MEEYVEDERKRKGMQEYDIMHFENRMVERMGEKNGLKKDIKEEKNEKIN